MASPELESTQSTLEGLLSRQGGGLFLEKAELLDVDYQTWITAVNVPFNFKPFSISIYDSNRNIDVVTLVLMINPKDINMGQAYVSSNTYTRVGWVTSIWGRQQMTIAFSGSSPGFYYMSPEGSGGITNFNRRGTAGFANFISLVGLFKNNAYYFLNSNNATIFKDGTSRVINVMDSIKIEYDGSTYLGSFTTFSMTDNAAMPYRIEYNIEFVVSSIGIDLEQLDGHISDGSNSQADAITIEVQGANAHLNEKFGLSEDELNTYYSVDEIKEEIRNEQYLRGGGEENVYQASNVSTTATVNTVELLEGSPQTATSVAEASTAMGLTQEQLASIITFESAGTWSPTIGNSRSSALGIGQWTNGAAQAMAKKLVELKLINRESECQSSRDLIRIFDTTDKQVALFPVYAQVTHVPGGRTLYQAMQNAKDSDERFDVYMMGHFYPAYVGKDLDTPFPANVQAANPNIRTPRDYIRRVKKIMANMNNMSRNKLDIVEEPDSTPVGSSNRQSLQAPILD